MRPFILGPFLSLVLFGSLAFVGCGESEGEAASGGGGAGAAASSSSSSGATGGGSAGGAGAVGGGGGAGGDPLVVNGFPDHWIDGTDCQNEPDVFTWAYADDTFILRQSLCTHFEAPFIYVLLGESMAFVQDTGTGNADVHGAVMAVVEGWASDHGLASLPVLVTHSHSHGDHVGGDGAFQGDPDTTVVGTSLAAVESAFGFQSWPDDHVSLDLGGRTLDVLAIPGHQTAHVAVYDRRHQLLLTGDTLYPGRLYINDWPAYRNSVARMVGFVDEGNPVTWVLGTHIELAQSGQDYALGAPTHPNEHPLELGYPVLLELHQATQAMGSSPSYQAHDDFIIFP